MRNVGACGCMIATSPCARRDALATPGERGGTMIPPPSAMTHRHGLIALDVRRWALWSQRPRLIGYCLLIELAALMLTVTGPASTAQSHDLRIFFLLAGMGVAQAELSRQVERLRRSISLTPHINMTSVWTFAAVLLLPVPYITAVVAVLYAHSAIRIWHRLHRVPAFRIIFNASLVVVTCLAARAVLTVLGFPGLSTAMHQGSVGFAPVPMLFVFVMVLSRGSGQLKVVDVVKLQVAL